MEWQEHVSRMERFLRLRGFPVAMKLFEDPTEMDSVPKLRRLNHPVTFCQLITLARTFGWTTGAGADDFVRPTCPAVLGLKDRPDYYKDGTFRSMLWVRTKEEGRRYEESIPTIPLGKYKAAAVGPLARNPFDPLMIFVYANPAQIILMINAYQRERYEVMNFFCVGESSCADAIARCYHEKKPFVSLPSYGERRFACVQDDELVMAMPPEDFITISKNLEELHRLGVRYPIAFAGAQLDPTPAYPKAYREKQKQG